MRIVRIGVRVLGILTVAVTLAGGAPAQVKFKTLYQFKGGKDGRNPMAGLILDQTGNLYGTTVGGGAHGLGTVFKLTPNQNGGWTESVLHSFCSLTNCADGEQPYAGLIFDQAGNLYGTTIYGGGSGNVFQLTPNQKGGWTESVLYRFCSVVNCPDGEWPRAGLIFDQAGNLYGTTSFDATDSGVVFQLTANQKGGWTESVLHSFGSFAHDGQQPYAGVIFDQAGNLYGTTHIGGAHNSGTVFQLTPNQRGGWTENVLHSFGSFSHDGQEPYAGLIFDQAGNLYGTTYFGGAHGNGTVFKLTPNQNGGWTESVLHSFCSFTNCADGEQPYAGLIFDQAGNLYGTTYSGGARAFGVVFKLTPTASGGWSYHVLHAFLDKPGVYPVGLIFDQAGNLYGTTVGDDIQTFGSVFEIMAPAVLQRSQVLFGSSPLGPP